MKINYTPKPYKAVENNWCDWMHSRHVRYHGKVRYRNVIYNLDVPVDSQLLMLRLIVDGYVHKVSQTRMSWFIRITCLSTMTPCITDLKP
jgi:hypothetical protein